MFPKLRAAIDKTYLPTLLDSKCAFVATLVEPQEDKDAIQAELQERQKQPRLLTALETEVFEKQLLSALRAMVQTAQGSGDRVLAAATRCCAWFEKLLLPVLLSTSLTNELECWRSFARTHGDDFVKSGVIVALDKRVREARGLGAVISQEQPKRIGVFFSHVEKNPLLVQFQRTMIEDRVVDMRKPSRLDNSAGFFRVLRADELEIIDLLFPRQADRAVLVQAFDLLQQRAVDALGRWAILRSALLLERERKAAFDVAAIRMKVCEFLL